MIGSGVTSSFCQTIGVSVKSSGSAQKAIDARKSAWRRLLSVENQDLSKVNDPELELAVSRLVGKKGGWGDLTVFGKISNEKRQVFYALIGEKQLFTIPGNSELFVNLFNEHGSHVKSIKFNSGWRISLRGQRIEFQKEIERESITVSSEPEMNGSDIVTQYYALIGTDLRLIRLEDSNGQLVRNNYEFPNHEIGPTTANRPKEDWERSLGSNDSAELLASLMWINGLHRDLSESAYFESRAKQETADQVKLVESIRKGKALSDLSQKYLGKNMKWLNDALNQKY
ncbi:MAG: hypothetical protein JNL64_01740 [Blastocatellia bacterium]|nr:hypothetical protein [Blastocatellia bacterium]